MQNNTPLLELMLQDQDNQQGVYNPGPYWKGYSARIREAVIEDGMENFRSNCRIGKGYVDIAQIDPFENVSNKSITHKVHKIIRTSPIVKKYFVNPYLESSQRHFDQVKKYRDLYYTEILGDWFSEFSKKYDLPDPMVENPKDVVSIDGYKMGSSYLASFLKIHNASQKIDFENITTMFEIGGGFGSFAHSLMHIFPNIKKYLYLDIPPVLYVGTQYLKHFYPDSMIDYTQTKSSETISFKVDDSREILAICPWQIDRLDIKADLFWNCGSFEEMTSEIVGNYAAHIKPLMSEQGKVCVVANEREKQGVLQASDIVSLFEKNGFNQFERFEPLLEINQNRYFLGNIRS